MQHIVEITLPPLRFALHVLRRMHTSAGLTQDSLSRSAGSFRLQSKRRDIRLTTNLKQVIIQASYDGSLHLKSKNDAKANASALRCVCFRRSR